MMASNQQPVIDLGHEGEVIEAAKTLFARIHALPASGTGSALRAAAERLEQALRAAQYELGRPDW
jgi:hypothetical protein